MECRNCPVNCGVDRTKQFGRCGVKGLSIAKYSLHPFEEPPISYRNGSGTIFFTGCNLRCVFCQNYELSRAERGKEITVRQLADLFRELENMGAENINLVTPDHVSHWIAEALRLYRPSVPVVYNSSGYTTKSALEEIFPLVDVFLPDVKFYSADLSERYTGRRDYFEYAIEAVKRMSQKQAVWRDGKLFSGLIVRHLVLPMGTSDSLEILRRLAEFLPRETPLSIMRQYTPIREVSGFPELTRRITAREYRRVVDFALSLGFQTLYTQDRSSAETSFIPDWDY